MKESLGYFRFRIQLPFRCIELSFLSIFIPFGLNQNAVVIVVMECQCQIVNGIKTK